MAATKEFIVSCVRDAAEMETRIYTLNETADQLKARAKALKAEVASEKEKEADACNMVKGLSYGEEKLLEYQKKHFFKGIIREKGRGWFAKCAIGWFFVVYLLLFYTAALGTIIIEPTAVYVICCVLVFLIVYPITFFLLLLKKRKGLMEERKEKIKATTEGLVRIQNIQGENQKVYALTLRKADSLVEQANICREKADEIGGILQNFYEKTEVIPPSYRRIDCMMIFVHVFRNDLADTMREAVTYYETQCFRNGVIRGLNNIAAQIGQLANAVRCVGEDIREINYNTSQLVRGTESVIENQRSIIDNQRVAIAETLATRYAVESLRYSHERYHAYR